MRKIRRYWKEKPGSWMAWKIKWRQSWMQSISRFRSTTPVNNRSQKGKPNSWTAAVSESSLLSERICHLTLFPRLLQFLPTNLQDNAKLPPDEMSGTNVVLMKDYCYNQTVFILELIQCRCSHVSCKAEQYSTFLVLEMCL